MTLDNHIIVSMSHKNFDATIFWSSMIFYVHCFVLVYQDQSANKSVAFHMITYAALCPSASIATHFYVLFISAGRSTVACASACLPSSAWRPVSN